MSSGPYRSAGDRGDAPPPEERASPPDLGALRSVHHGGGVLGTQVELHENGLVVRRPLKEPVEVPFDAIDAIHYDFEQIVPGPPRVTLVTFEGATTILPNDLTQLARIVSELERQVTQPVVVRAREALARGERMVFGPLVIELDGLELEGRSLEWAHVSRVDAERDAFVIYAREPRGRFGWARVRDIPHPRALIEVLGLRTTVVMRGMSLLP